MKIFKRTGTIIVTLCCGFLLAACGGGSDSDGGGVPSSYTGEQTQATIDSTNAKAIVLAAYDSGSATDLVGVIDQVPAPATLSVSENPALPRPLALAQALQTAAQSMDLYSGVRMAAAIPITVPGDCGGSMTYTLDQNGYSFTGSMNFSDYCSGGENLNGGVSFSASVNPDTQAVKMTMSFSSLTSSASQEGFAVSGSLTISADPNGTTPASLSMAIVMTDLATGKTFYAKYAVAVTEGAGYEEVKVSGRFYASDYGYVDISTAIPVRTLEGAPYPSSGVLKFSGAGDSFATMTFADGGSYEIACSDGSPPITGVLQ